MVVCAARCGMRRKASRPLPAIAAAAIVRSIRLWLHPFMGFFASALKFSARTLTHIWKLSDGREAVRNSRNQFGSLLFGGTLAKGQYAHALRRHA